MQPQRIIFDGHSGIGDTMQYIAALLSLRAMYPKAELLVTTNQCGKEILGLCPFIDRLAVVWEEGGSADPANLQRFVQQAKHFTIAKDAKDKEINDPELPAAELIVCVERNKELLEAALSTGAEVVSFYTPLALTNKNLRLVLPFSRYHMHEMVRYQHLIQGCDPALYKESFPKLDLTQVRLTPPEDKQQLVDDFLLKTIAKCRNKAGSVAPELTHLIILNPLSLTAEKEGKNFKHADYVALGEELAQRYPQCLVLLSSFGEQEFHHIPRKAPNLELFVNPSNMMALLALVHRSSLVIAPSTGTAHLADNQSVDLCGIYEKQGSYRWGAGGLQQLTQKQAKMLHSATPDFNHCAYTFIKQGWKSHYESYRKEFFEMCLNFVETYTLKRPPKLTELLKQHQSRQQLDQPANDPSACPNSISWQD